RLGDHAPGGALPRRLRVEKVRGLQAAGARHRLHDDGGIARDVPTDETAHHASEVVVGAAGGKADMEIDHLVLEERLCALREAVWRRDGDQHCGQRSGHVNATMSVDHEGRSCPLLRPRRRAIMAAVPPLSTGSNGRWCDRRPWWRDGCRLINLAQASHDIQPSGETPMNVITKTRFEVVPLSRHIGSEIRGLDLRQKPDGHTIKAIYQTWLDHIVIIFPEQKLSQEDLIRVTGYFGEQGMPRRPAKFFPKGYSQILPGIMLISNIRENGEPIGALPDGEMMFHHDMIHSEMPDKGTLLYSVEIPSAGGNTLFASGYAAYDALDPQIRSKLEGRRALHH